MDAPPSVRFMCRQLLGPRRVRPPRRPLERWCACPPPGEAAPSSALALRRPPPTALERRARDGDQPGVWRAGPRCLEAREREDRPGVCEKSRLGTSQLSAEGETLEVELVGVCVARPPTTKRAVPQTGAGGCAGTGGCPPPSLPSVCVAASWLALALAAAQNCQPPYRPRPSSSDCPSGENPFASSKRVQTHKKELSFQVIAGRQATPTHASCVASVAFHAALCRTDAPGGRDVAAWAAVLNVTRHGRRAVRSPGPCAPMCAPVPGAPGGGGEGRQGGGEGGGPAGRRIEHPAAQPMLVGGQVDGVLLRSNAGRLRRCCPAVLRSRQGAV